MPRVAQPFPQSHRRRRRPQLGVPSHSFTPPASHPSEPEKERNRRLRARARWPDGSSLLLGDGVFYFGLAANSTAAEIDHRHQPKPYPASTASTTLLLPSPLPPAMMIPHLMTCSEHPQNVEPQLAHLPVPCRRMYILCFHSGLVEGKERLYDGRW